MIPTPSAISKPKSTGIIIKEEKPDFTYFLYQDAQDPWEAFLPLSQHLQNLQPTPPTPAPDDPTNKVSSSTPLGSTEHPSSSWCKIICPWPPCRPDHQHPPETPRPSLNVFFSQDKDATDSSSDEDYMNHESLISVIHAVCLYSLFQSWLVIIKSMSHVCHALVCLYCF